MKCFLLILWLMAAVLHAEELSLSTSSGTLYGTLELPHTPHQCPVILIIAGSGPTDRDGNSSLLSGKNDSLKMLAKALAAHGIASLRTDKRGIAASAAALAREEDIRFDHYAADAEAWVNLLHQDSRFYSVSILGHSEGSLIGMLAAQQTRVSAFLSLAGAGRNLADVMEEQLTPQLTPALLNQAVSVLNELRAGRLVSNYPAALASLFRPSVQPYLISLFRHDPQEEITRLQVPVLILQGTTDIQIKPLDAQNLAQAHTNAQLSIIEGMNHILKMVPDDPVQQLDSYSNPNLPLSTNLVSLITDFMYSRVCFPNAAAILHLNARANREVPNAIAVSLSSGSYLLVPFVGQYTGWSTLISGQACWAAWFNIRTESEIDRVVGDPESSWDTALNAMANSPWQSLELAEPQNVLFSLPAIGGESGNGGLSLAIIPVIQDVNLQLKIIKDSQMQNPVLAWTGLPNHSYQLLSSRDLRLWQLETESPGAAAGTQFQVKPNSTPHQFFRIVSIR